jgi:hypothetical protein
MHLEIKHHANEELRDAYFQIDVRYMVARSDLFRLWVLHKYGGMWLDLRGKPREDPEEIGLETLLRLFRDQPLPPLLFSYSGMWHKELGLPFKRGQYYGYKKFGEIMSGFMLSEVGNPVWPLVWARVVDMIRTYPDRWKKGQDKWTRGEGEVQRMDESLTYYVRPMSMQGRTGVLSMGPLAMTTIVFQYLLSVDALSTCVPQSLDYFWEWNKNDVKKRKKGYEASQAELLYRDPTLQALHDHYSRKTTPIVYMTD